MITPDDSTEDILKSQSVLEWWYLAPVVFAIVMFLLIGSLFEHEIEAFCRNIVVRRQAQLSQSEETQQEVTVPVTVEAPSPTPLEAVKTPSLKSIKVTEECSAENKVQGENVKA